MTKKTILIIDNDPIFVRGFGDVLKSEGFNVITAYEGITGIQQAYEYIPDLILLDIMMPHFDGFKVCQHLKHDDQTKHIKIILVTGSVDTPEDEERGRAMADDFIIKGGPAQVKLERIRKLLSE